MEPILSQEVVIQFLVEAGGKVRNSELLQNFRNELAQNDAQRKREARELFKRFINNVAVVREEEGVKFVVLKKKLQHLIAAQPTPSPAAGREKEEGNVGKTLGKVESLGNLVEAGEATGGFHEPGARRNSAPSALTAGHVGALGGLPAPLENRRNAETEAVPPAAKHHHSEAREWENSTESHSLHRAKSDSLEQVMENQHLKLDNLPGEQHASADEGLSGEGAPTSACPAPSAQVPGGGNAEPTTDIVPKPDHLVSLPPSPTDDSSSSFEQKIGNYEAKSSDVGTPGVPKATSTQKPKPYMHPLRLPPDSNRYGNCHNHHQDKKKGLEDVVPFKNGCPLVSGDQDASKTSKMKRSQPTEMGSPHLKRASKFLNLPEDARFSDQVPLDPIEHEWIVKTALGHWTQVSGLLLKDSYLAEKKDFMSGFTVIHWAAKSGNSEIMCWIIDTAEGHGIKMDINSKAYGGYTPLHIAAIHGRENIIVELVQNYGARTTLRDYSGKRPYHYLNKDNSVKVRQLLGDPEPFISESIPHKRGSKVASSILSSTNTLLGALADDMSFQEFSKSLKKTSNLSKFFTAPVGHKKRAKMRMNFTSLNEEEEEREEIVLKHRPVTEVFF
ncbi:ankyrin repeat domain-containing protein SOWAHA [Carcharodon carcharias]|uniref:ankyrin repeat domain-containing protein SOWAHA n=1 Tax=Carcharodon carcharias TaxID=13397 RepID=UPI001B7E56F2|nr:ankyrin repeat domain-containing protein SOWAHA [Carcharodon carcharias]